MEPRFESYIAKDETIGMIISLGKTNSGALLAVNVYMMGDHPETGVESLKYEDLVKRLKADETLLAYYLDRVKSSRHIGVIHSEREFSELKKLATVEERIFLCHIIGIGELPLQELIKTCLPETKLWMERI